VLPGSYKNLSAIATDLQSSPPVLLIPTMAFAGIVSLALLASPIVAAPNTRATKLDVQSFGGETTGKYIVKLKGSSDKASVMGGFSSFSDSTSANITHEWKPKFFNGFAGEFDDAALDALRANSDVESIVEDGIMKAFATVEQYVDFYLLYPTRFVDFPLQVQCSLGPFSYLSERCRLRWRCLRFGLLLLLR